MLTLIIHGRTGVCGVGVLVSVLVTPREAEDAILFMIVEVNLLIVTCMIPLPSSFLKMRNESTNRESNF